MFYVGQKVVCVDDKPSTYTGKGLFSHVYGRRVSLGTELNGLKEGEVYTIIGFDTAHDGSDGVHLREINRPILFGKKPPYIAKRFRPLVEKKTDISIFTELLNKKPVEALEKA